MKSVIILLGTLATAVLLAEAIVSDWLQFYPDSVLMLVMCILGSLPVQLPYLWKM